jgi:bacterioferritin
MAMDRTRLIDKLNEAISLELSGVLLYNQYAQVLIGEDRKIWRQFFLDESDEGLKHARLFAERVVALGGTPSVETEPVRQVSDIHAMLVNGLEYERRAVEVYTQALEIAQEDPAYRNLIEGQVYEETKDCEEFEMYLGQAVEAGGVARRSEAA